MTLSPAVLKSGADPARSRHFASLLGGLEPELRRFALWLCRDPAAAEDIVQESLLRAWRGADSLRDERSIKAWLLTIVRHEHARRRARSKREPTSSLDELTEAQEEGLAAEDDLPLEDLRRAIVALQPAYREPLVLQVLQGLSTKEIARRLDLSRSAVLTRLFRAREQLREQFLGTQGGR